MEKRRSSHQEPPKRIALVDDEPAVRRALKAILERAAYRVVEYGSGEAFLAARGEALDAACMDIGLGAMSGIDTLLRMREERWCIPVVVVTGELDIETAVKAMRAGARDYVTKPVDSARLLRALDYVLGEVEGDPSEPFVGRVSAPTNEHLVGASTAMAEVARQIAMVATSSISVCIFGESGTGKELVARAIHERSGRRAGPFVTVNCAAIPESLQEAEMFGHERGAFTGAMQQRKGNFELAQGGTLFLDELGEMSSALQATLLRSIQDRTIRRVGGDVDIPVDVRFVCATHRDLRRDVRERRFREDLFYRLVVYPIQLAPLRDRRDDIPLLVEHFLRLFADGNPSATIDPAALEAIREHSFPGNVRELANVVHRSLVTCLGNRIQLEHLPIEIRAPRSIPPPKAPDGPQGEGAVLRLREVERRAADNALQSCGGNVTRAAKLLGIGRATLYRWLAEGTPD